MRQNHQKWARNPTERVSPARRASVVVALW